MKSGVRKQLGGLSLSRLKRERKADARYAAEEDVARACKSWKENYLDAETDVAQERWLAQWCTTHGAEPDEEAVAKLVLAEYPEAVYDAGERVFEAMMALRRKRMVRWACGMAACLAVAVGLGISLSLPRPAEFNGWEIAQGIERIMSLDMEQVECVTARPKGKKVILTAVMKDGSRCAYVMRKDGGTSSVSIAAMGH